MSSSHPNFYSTLTLFGHGLFGACSTIQTRTRLQMRRKSSRISGAPLSPTRSPSRLLNLPPSPSKAYQILSDPVSGSCC